MALFLRGEVWWFEWRTRRERVVKSTGFRKNEKRKAQAAYDAFRFAKKAKPPRAVVQGMLEAVYGGACRVEGLSFESGWLVYRDWCEGKGRSVSKHTASVVESAYSRFSSWAEARGVSRVEDVDVSLAREFVGEARAAGRANKTQRNLAQTLSHVWGALGQVRGELHNPWKAATPDRDGTAVRLEAFSPEEEERVLAAAEEAGHGWRLACEVARWTGLRYGDVARLSWEDVDMEAGVLRVEPSKTKRHGVKVTLPLAAPLRSALEAARGESVGAGFVLPEHALRYGLLFEPPFAEVLRAAGVDTATHTFHSWRHTFRTRLSEAGVSDDVARRLGGWTNLEMAAHYDHAGRLDELREAVEAMAEKKPGRD